MTVTTAVLRIDDGDSRRAPAPRPARAWWRHARRLAGSGCRDRLGMPAARQSRVVAFAAAVDSNHFFRDYAR